MTYEQCLKVLAATIAHNVVHDFVADAFILDLVLHQEEQATFCHNTKLTVSLVIPLHFLFFHTPRSI